MKFEYYLKEQIKKHSSIGICDVVKMCYQASHGAEHMLSDPDRARSYLENEFLQLPASDGDLYERISDRVYRVNLSPWKAKGLPLEWLFRMFLASCKVEADGDVRMSEYLDLAESCLPYTDIDGKAWAKYIHEYKAAGMPAVHHSEEYRVSEHPAYRIVDSRFIRTLPILEAAKDYACIDKPCVIAVDGRAASGKTTLAESLKTVLSAEVVHTDDFFLPADLRTEERLSEVGGNIHYERFLEEVIPYISKNEAFSYRVFDCGNMDFCGTREIAKSRFRIVEGTYSRHPSFSNYADITVFCDVAPKEQTDRILRRNGEAMLERFRSTWIPMEEEYFKHCSIEEKSDITLDQSDGTCFEYKSRDFSV